MFGDLIARLDRPDVASAVLATLEPPLMWQIEQRAAVEGMAAADFIAGAVREFVDYADDESWFQLLTVIRSAADPGLTAVQTILRWAVTGHPPLPEP